MRSYQIIFCLPLIAATTHAQEPVVIFGQAETKSGSPVEALVVEPQSQVPINTSISKKFEQPSTMQKEKKHSETLKAQDAETINQISVQNPKPFSISPSQEQNEIENTLYESGGRIYDVQSYPLKDIKAITTPNIDQTISTYPEY